MAQKADPNPDVQAGAQDMPLWAAMGGKVTIGGVCGYMVGNFCKQISDEAILYGGMAALLVGGLHWMRWITINWK